MAEVKEYLVNYLKNLEKDPIDLGEPKHLRLRELFSKKYPSKVFLDEYAHFGTCVSLTFLAHVVV